MSTPPSFLYFFRVSEFCKFDLCPKLAKIVCFKEYDYIPSITNKYMQKGTEIHEELHGNKVERRPFDEICLRYQLGIDELRVYEFQVDDWVLRGRCDDIRVIFNRKTQKKYVVLLETYTTSKDHVWELEAQVKISQLQYYIAMYKPMIESLGWTLWKRHYVEIRSQKDQHLMERIPVYEIDVPEKIRLIKRTWNGEEPSKYPPKWYCKKCPKYVKKKCWMWNNEKYS